ncbi:MAG TPA: hypothetical protein VMS94_03530 [Acidobacteriota bacterium]|jgi:heme-degrading monooxygenase HmoA|nr:hypothetical protein [Acidobacteriota bacterium]
MVLARVASWKFKHEMRLKGFDALEKTITEATRKTKGFRGSMVLLPVGKLDTGVVITIWENENSLKSYSRDVVPRANRPLKKYVIGHPNVKLYRVFSAELKY